MKDKRLIFNGVLVLAVLVLAYFQFFRSDRIVYVDTNVLMGKYQGMIDARAEFEKKAATWQANVDTLIKGFQDELKNYEKERSRMSAREKELKEELLNNKQMQINQFREAMGKKYRDEEGKMTQSVLNMVNDYVKEFGKRKGYKYILGANGSGSLVYTQEKFDITEELLKGLNDEYGKLNRKGK